MLKSYEQQRISEYTKLYDLIVGKEHLLRKIKDNIDFSFVNPMLKKSYCEHFGRPAKEPNTQSIQKSVGKIAKWLGRPGRSAKGALLLGQASGLAAIFPTFDWNGYQL